MSPRLARHLNELADGFTIREVYRRGWTALDSKEDVEAALEVLSDADWVRELPEAKRITGRPPSRAFEINPKVRNMLVEELTKQTEPAFGSFVSESAGGKSELSQGAAI
jgi:hypothetical protein